MKYIFTIIGFLFLNNSDAQEWNNFSNDSILFTAKYPANWTSKIKEGKKVFFTSPGENKDDQFFENINIIVTFNESYSSFKITDAIPEVIAELKKGINEFTLESQREFNLNNTSAVEIIYTGYSPSYPGLKARFIQRFCIYNSHLYVITFTAEAANSSQNATALKIMNSIQFK